MNPKENLVSYLEKLPGIVLALNRQNEILFRNSSFDALPEDTESRKDSTGSPPPCRKALLSACRQVLQTGRSLSFDTGEVGAAGTISWYQCSVTPILNEHQKPEVALANCLDITARKKEEEQFKRSNDLLIDAQGIAHLGTWEWDLSQSIITWSSELFRIYGVRPEEYSPSFEGYLEKVHPDDRERVRQTMMRAVDEHNSFSHDERIIRTDGSIRYLHTWGHCVLNESGKLIRLIGVCQDITDRKMAEEELQKTLKLLSAIVEGTSDAVFIKDIEGRYLTINSAGARFLGKKPDEVIGRTDLEFLPSEIALEFRSSDLRAINSEEARTYEDTGVIEREKLTFLANKGPYCDAQGNIIGMIGIARDITYLKKVNEALENSLSTLQATLESTADGILVIDNEEEVTEYNQRFLDLWRIPQGFIEERGYKEALHFVLDQLVNPEKYLERLQEISAKPDTDSSDEIFFKDGRVYDRYSRPQRIGSKITGRVFSYRDITEHRHAEEQILQNAARMKALDEASRTFVEARLDLTDVLHATVRCVADFFQDGSMARLFSEDKTYYYTAAYHHVDPEALDLMRQILPHVHTIMDKKATNQLLQSGKPIRGTSAAELALLEINPEYQPFFERFPIHTWIVVPLKVAGQITGTISVFRFKPGPPYSADDETFLQELADRAALSIDNARLYNDAQKAIQMREDFMSIASHELKTPLTPLKLQIQLLAHFISTGVIEPGKKAQEIEKLITSSDQQVAKLDRLVEDLLDTSRIKSGKLALQQEKVNLAEMVAEVTEEYAPQITAANCTVRLHTDPSVYGCWDRVRIEQAITNLLSNALKYGAGKPVDITVTTKDGRAVFAIRDHGIGIARDFQEKIFSPFERAVSVKSFGGLGLGLYITQQIVEAHHGHISLESRPGKGSLFTVELPLEAASVQKVLLPESR